MLEPVAAHIAAAVAVDNTAAAAGMPAAEAVAAELDSVA